VNTAVDYVFTNNVRLEASAGASAMNSGNYRPQNTQALFDSLKSTNEDGEVVMDQDAIENFMNQIGVDP